MKVVIIIVICFLNVFDFGHALGESCTENANCKFQEKSVCLNGTCACDTLWYYYKYNELEGEGKCLKYASEYRSVCYEDEQCKFFGQNSKCQKNTCQCETGYWWYQGNCQKYANKGEDCDNTTVICLDPSNPLSLTCGADNTCQCTKGYYDREDDCRLKSGVDKECAITMDCFPAENLFGIVVESHCELGICIENHEDDPVATINIGTNEERRRADEPDDDVCLKPLSDLTPEECKNCSNTLYFNDTACICKQGFFLGADGKCIAELGMTDELTYYKDGADCPIKPGKAVDGACYCKDFWFQDSTNRECKKTTLEYTQNCMDNDWCRAMGKYAYCNAETRKCQCTSQTEFNETSFYCNLKEDANMTGICLSNTDCELYETCADERCQCTDGFYRVEESGLCLPKIGYSCEFRDCNHIDGAFCNETEVCTCGIEDFVTDGLLCLQPAVQLYDECLIEAQCKNLNNTGCLLGNVTPTEDTTTRCLCSDEYTDVEGFCYNIKYPGSMCTTQRDCTIILGDTFVCRNMLCQCPIGKSLSQDNICDTNSANKRTLHTPLAVVVALLISLRYSIE